MQQENQFDAVTETEDKAAVRHKKVKRQAFFGGMFWGIIIGSIFSCSHNGTIGP